MWETLYIESSFQTSAYYSWRENVRKSSLPTKNAIKDNPNPHKRVHSSALACKILNSACNISPYVYNKYQSACDEHRSACKTA